MNSKELIKRLELEGWTLMAVVGSHHKYCHPEKPGRVVVPHPRKDLVIGTLRNIYRQAGWQWKE